MRYVKRRAAEGCCTQCGNLGAPIYAKGSKDIIGRRRKCKKHLKAEREAKARKKEKELASQNGQC